MQVLVVCATREAAEQLHDVALPALARNHWRVQVFISVSRVLIRVLWRHGKWLRSGLWRVSG